MIETGRTPPVRAEDLTARLRERGFELTEHGAHVLAVRDVARVVVPAPGRALPDTFVRRIEHALEPVLGPLWLTRDPAPTSAESEVSALDDVVVLDAVVDRCPTSGVWCSFLPCEPAVMGFGPTRHAALSDLKDASALWIGAPRASILLVTDTVV